MSMPTFDTSPTFTADGVTKRVLRAKLPSLLSP
jgi:hypothetical protein